jgi:hypothetical protein
MTLGYSRKSVRLLVLRSSSRIWAELHEKAFRRLGGSVRVVVLDNLREGVIAPDIYDPTLNPLYQDVLAHYGTVAMPCRIKDPDRKGKVEAGVGHAQKTPLKGLRFESLEEAQDYSPESGFDPFVFESEDDSFWARFAKRIGSERGIAQFWYCKFYKETFVGQMLLLGSPLLRWKFDGTAKTHALLWVLIVLTSLILIRLGR